MFLLERGSNAGTYRRGHHPATLVVTLTLLTGLLSTACSTETPLGPSDPQPSSASSAGLAEAVTDLVAVSSTDSTITLAWTEVSDGSEGPATYRVRYAPTPIDKPLDQDGCDDEIVGRSVGDKITCTVVGLEADTEYGFQLVSYRHSGEIWQGARSSNVTTGRTARRPEPTPADTSGIWISPAEISGRPTSGSAWTGLVEAASHSCGGVDLSDQEQSTNACIFAKALVFARTGEARYRSDVVAAISEIVESGTYTGRALSLARELGAYVVAADLVGLPAFDPELDAAFRAKLRSLRTTPTNGSSVATNLVTCHETRPNNWGAHCGATRAAIAVYLGDTADLARVAKVFKGFLGDRASYAGFEFGDLSWQCDASRPVGINPAGCRKDGRVVDGIIPDDQRRSGTWEWPAPHENYVWESLQGLLAQAVILSRAGYPVWEWEDRALLRAVTWVHDVNGFPAEGDDRWLIHIVNRAYGTEFPAATPTTAGKSYGWTDWTHG